MDPIDAGLKGIASIVIILCFYGVARLLRALRKNLTLHNLGRVSAVVESTAKSAVQSFKAGRRSGM